MGVKSIARSNTAASSVESSNEDWWSEPWRPVWGEKLSPRLVVDGTGLMECFVKGLEHSMDLLSCEENRAAPAANLRLKNKAPFAAELLKRDYAKLHDELLESLLQEQSRRSGDATDILSSTSSFSSTSRPEEPASTPPTVTKRKRALKLPRRKSATSNPRSPSKRQIADLSILEARKKEDMLSMSTSSSIRSSVTTQTLPEPESYIDDICRLQKDKGRGETPGSNICATGKAACLEKLRQKMELLTQVAATGGGPSTNAIDKKKMNKKRGTANMKRRTARVTEEAVTYTETRSLIELRMGFLSMTYGVLLRWDTTKTGRVNLVVLRKMCHESFYHKERVSSRRVLNQAMLQEPPACVMDSTGANYVILQRTEGTEVALLEPPYRVQRPTVFGPSFLTIANLTLHGFNEKAINTVHVSFEGSYHSSRLQYDADLECLEPVTDEPFEWEVPPSLLDLQLHIRVFEQRRPRNRRKKLAAHETICLNFLDSIRVSHGRHVSIQCRRSGARISLNVLHQSDYAHWLQQELEARRREEVKKCNVPFRQHTTTRQAEPDYYADVVDLCCVW